MRKHPAKTRRWTPCVVMLEGRALLSALDFSTAAGALAPAAHKTTTGHPIAPHPPTDLETIARDGFDNDDLVWQAAPQAAGPQSPGARELAPVLVARNDHDTSAARILPWGDPDDLSQGTLSGHLIDARPAGALAQGRPPGSSGAFDSTDSSAGPGQPGPEGAADRLDARLRLARRGRTATTPPAEPQAIPGPQGLGMIAEALPFGRDSLERAVDRVFAGIDDLAPRPVTWQRASVSVLPPLGLAALAMAMEIQRRRASPGRSARPIASLRVPGVGPGAGRRRSWNA